MRAFDVDQALLYLGGMQQEVARLVEVFSTRVSRAEETEDSVARETWQACLDAGLAEVRLVETAITAVRQIHIERANFPLQYSVSEESRAALKRAERLVSMAQMHIAQLNDMCRAKVDLT